MGFVQVCPPVEDFTPRLFLSEVVPNIAANSTESIPSSELLQGVEAAAKTGAQDTLSSIDLLETRSWLPRG
uniref:Uncharacterized protein n=1 Tax=Solanum tuberosum TaxID=4113 RepID=M1BEE7_SOLTU